ncbi:MAG: 4Fe-4S binding protein, partial [candidate division Zixibacteria bacterium]|nr:4Fe-4S binding protein [candidate division Zixibacteria bacterium]
EEWCPTSPKAIYLREEVAFDSDGNEVKIKRPYVDPEHCTGCGACEFACPVVDKPAIYVTAIGESRSPGKQLLLGGQKKIKS